ncbi:MAG: glutaredoxin domain-containing protein [Microgenomates group bacterium]
MNLAYFRKSNFDFDKTLENLKQKAKEKNLQILGEVSLVNDQGKVINICSSTWLGNLLSSDKNLIGLLPCSVAILKKGKEVLVGVGSASLLGRVSQDPAIYQVAQSAEKTLKELVNDSCGVGPLKVKKVKLYATTTCPYCKMEASWLDSHKINYEHTLVDLNQKEAEKMVQKTGQMGVPVTEIVYDNDEEEYIIGFDKERLSEILQIKN